MSYIAGKDVEKTRVPSVESVLKCGGLRYEVRFASKGRNEL